MSTFLDTEGQTTLGIGLCARCSRKFPLGELTPDPNYPALMVCREDLDDFDPYRLSAAPNDTITLPFIRPDEALSNGATSQLPQLTLTADGVHIFRID